MSCLNPELSEVVLMRCQTAIRMLSCDGTSHQVDRYRSYLGFGGRVGHGNGVPGQQRLWKLLGALAGSDARGCVLRLALLQACMWEMVYSLGFSVFDS